MRDHEQAGLRSIFLIRARSEQWMNAQLVWWPALALGLPGSN